MHYLLIIHILAGALALMPAVAAVVSSKGKKVHIIAGTIAVITAVLVTNIYIEPVFILWILPTIVITPIIFWWNRKYTVSNKAI